MKYKIKSAPAGISLPKSGLEVIMGLNVKARRVGDKFIVTKHEIVYLLKNISRSWADFWNNASVKIFEFPV